MSIDSQFCMGSTSDGKTVIQCERFLNHRFGPGAEDFQLFDNSPYTITHLVMVPGDKSFITGDEGGTLKLWDLSALSVRASKEFEIRSYIDLDTDELEFLDTPVLGLAISGNGKRIAWVDCDGNLQHVSPSLRAC